MRAGSVKLPYQAITHHGRAIVETLRGHGGALSRLYYDRPLVGAEIGVWRGKNAATMLARMPRLKLYLVDMWGTAPTVTDGDPLQGDVQMVEALAETSFAAARRVVVRCASPAAVGMIPELLDFVFIDGDHRYEHCLADLRAWWPLVKPGGWLMGHDIDNAGDIAVGWGVRQAVEEFCQEVGGLNFEARGWPEMVFSVRKPTP